MPAKNSRDARLPSAGGRRKSKSPSVASLCFAGREPPLGTGYLNRVRRSGLIEAGYQNRVLKSEILCRTIHRMTVSSDAEEKPLYAINQGPADLC